VREERGGDKEGPDRHKKEKGNNAVASGRVVDKRDKTKKRNDDIEVQADPAIGVFKFERMTVNVT